MSSAWYNGWRLASALVTPSGFSAWKEGVAGGKENGVANLTALNNGSRKLQNSASELSQTLMCSFLFSILFLTLWYDFISETAGGIIDLSPSSDVKCWLRGCVGVIRDGVRQGDEFSSPEGRSRKL